MQWPDALKRTLWSCRSLVWLASWIVPASLRKEWLHQHSHRVWHWAHFLKESNQLNRENRLLLARYCWNAFPEALWLRFDRDEFMARRRRLRVSPAACLAALALLLIVGAVTTLPIFKPSTILSSPIDHPDQVYLITVQGSGLNGRFQRVRSETLLELTNAWRTSDLLDGIAAYSWGPGKLDLPEREVPIVSARVAPNFFELLGVKATSGRTFQSQDAQNCSNCIVISYELWQNRFDRDPAILGQRVVLDGSERVVIGVLPVNFHLLSAGISTWTLLEPSAPTFTNFVRRIGAVTRFHNHSPVKVQSQLTDLSEDAGYRFPDSQLAVTSVQSQWRDSLWTYGFLLLLVISCAIAVVYARGVSAGVGRAPLSRRNRLRWWSFFVVKSAMLLGIMFLVASKVARIVSVFLTGSVYPMAGELGVWLFLIFAILALSWAVHDQQRRCRICLRRLGMSVDIGNPGAVLLNYAGSELVCPEGHGVLYLPDSRANWFERDRWNNFDDSWADLFGSR